MAIATRIMTYGQAGNFRLRGMLLKFLLRSMGCKVGKRLRAAGWPIFRLYPSGNVEIGDNVTLGREVTFEIASYARLKIGNHVNLSDRLVLSTLSEIVLEDWVSIAENCGIRGSFHQTSASTLAVLQPSDSEPIHVGKGVGIGANSTILMGVFLPEGAIVGAHSLLNNKVAYQPYGIYAGAPARLIRVRE